MKGLFLPILTNKHYEHSQLPLFIGDTNLSNTVITDALAPNTLFCFCLSLNPIPTLRKWCRYQNDQQELSKSRGNSNLKYDGNTFLKQRIVVQWITLTWQSVSLSISFYCSLSLSVSISPSFSLRLSFSTNRFLYTRLCKWLSVSLSVSEYIFNRFSFYTSTSPYSPHFIEPMFIPMSITFPGLIKRVTKWYIVVTSIEKSLQLSYQVMASYETRLNI